MHQVPGSAYCAAPERSARVHGGWLWQSRGCVFTVTPLEGFPFSVSRVPEHLNSPLTCPDRWSGNGYGTSVRYPVSEQCTRAQCAE